MPPVQVRPFRDEKGRVPARAWLDDLKKTNRRAWVKCLDRIATLSEQGHELRRPIAAHLRDGIWELRAQVGTVNYRMLYFFHGSEVAVISHGLTKEDKVPDGNIEYSIRCRTLVKKDPTKSIGDWS